MHKLYKLDGDNAIDLTNLTGKITRRSTSDEVAEELSFPFTSEDELKNDILQEGDIIILKNDTDVLFKGVVVKRSSDGRFKQNIQCFDFGWYLNKNEDIYQFNNTVSENIKRIMNDYQITIGNIVDIPTIHKDINRGSLISIIKEMLKKAEKDQGKRYRFEIREDKFYLEELNSDPITYNTSLITGKEENINKYIKDPKITTSIDGMYNSVKIVSEEKNTITTIANNEDQTNIKKYGKLQKLETLSKEDSGNGANIAQNQLQTLNKIVHDISVELLGNDACRANRVITIEEPVTGISGNFNIKKCTHNISATSHTMQLDLEVI